MTGLLPSILLPDTPQPKVVATIHHPDDLLILTSTLPPNSSDILEFRLDQLLSTTTPADLEIPSPPPLPSIITARHPQEGGANGLNDDTRLELILKHIPVAAAVDIEIASLNLIQEIAPRIESQETNLILSWHDFEGTPSLEELRSRIENAKSLGADIVKLATKLRSLDDLNRLLELVTDPPSLPLSVMGMGALGPTSRILLGQYGSCLNYGYLSQPNAPGQWPAHLLKTALESLGPINS